MTQKTGLVIAVDKPVGWTSFQVVNKLKWLIKRAFNLKKFKIGHAGTLDPLASGLLLVCVGNATKRIEELQAGIKVYSGSMVLGATTPCYDLEQAIDHYYPFDHINPDSIEIARNRFLGDIEQVPPMFSAVKVDGQRAYLSARNGDDVEISPKTVTVYDFTVNDFRQGSPDFVPPAPITNSNATRELYRNPQGCVPEGLPQIDFRITCSKGTYIRSIARDFGLELNSGAFLASLRRERIGDFSLADAYSLEALESAVSPSNPVFCCLTELQPQTTN